MAKAQKKKTEKALAKKETTALAVPGMDFGADAGGGFEEADKDAFAIPFLQLLQKGSPQVDDDKDQYIDGAKPGMFLNSVTGELFDEVLIVPAHYQRQFVNWRDRDEGGGWLGSYPPSDPILESAQRDESGKFILEDGSYLSDTRYHFVLIVKDNGATEPAVLGLASTQIKKSRALMSLMNGIKLKRADGSVFTPPTFSHVYKLTSVGEAKQDYTWKGVKFELVRMLTEKEISVYQAAKDFKTQIMSGEAKAGDPGAGLNEDSVPEEY
jgi:hypothetical protein